MSNSGASVVLACHHVMNYDPQPTAGDLVYCRKCRKYRIVQLSKRESKPQTKRARKYGHILLTRVECNDCKYARNYKDPHVAQVRGQAHAIRYTHVVIVISPQPGDSVIRLTSQGS